MEFPDWTYAQSLNTTFHQEMYDQQLHHCGNIVPFSTNWYNFQSIPSMAADFLNPGGLDQVFPMPSPPDLVTVQYDDNMMSSWHNNKDPDAQDHLFNIIPEEATWENPLFYIPGEATPENPDNPEFSVSNFLGQSDLNANYSLPEPPQFTNCMQSSKNGLSFAMDTLEEYDGIPTIPSDLEKLAKSMSHNGNHSVEASNNEFSDIICMENELEQTISQISRETNRILTTIHNPSGIMNNSAANHTDNLLAKFMNPEIDFPHALVDDHTDLKEPRWEKATPLSITNIPEPSLSQTADTMISPIKEMIYYAAVLMPLNLDHEVVEKDQKPNKRKNVRISSEPRTVAARQRRERISEKLKVLQRLVPGGGKLDTASMLEEAANYLKFLKAQIQALEDIGHTSDNSVICMPMNLKFYPLPSCRSFPVGNNISLHQLQNPRQCLHLPQD